MAPGKTRPPPGPRRHDLAAAPPEGVLAAPADRDELAAWLAGNWGTLADAPAELLDQIEF